MVISGGVNIYPREIEERLHAHPAVIEAAVIGVADAEWGEALRAFVVLRPNLAEAERPSVADLRVFLQSTLANFKIPRDIRFVEALPRNPTGKVLKREPGQACRRASIQHENPSRSSSGPPATSTTARPRSCSP